MTSTREIEPVGTQNAGCLTKAFRRLKNGATRTFGEHRTRRLALAAWDTLQGH